MKRFIIPLFVLTFILSTTLTAQEKSQKDSKGKYLLEMKHTKEECLQALDEVNNSDKNLLSRIDWGCGEGNHTGYMTVEAKDASEATKDLPEAVKKRTEVHKVAKISSEEIRKFHQE